MARNADDWGNNPYAAPGSDLDNDLNDPDLYPEGYNGPVVYGGFWYRFLATFVDGILQQIISGVFAFVFGALYGLTAVARGGINDSEIMFLNIAGYVIGAVVAWLYNALQESSAAQATVGKRLVGLKVTDLDGDRISFGRATGRHFGKFLSSIFLIGFLMQPFTEKKQALHDMMAGTLVVKK